jgi:hypothetical protein
MTGFLLKNVKTISVDHEYDDCCPTIDALFGIGGYSGGVGLTRVNGAKLIE